jgi:hypothetical protein
VRREPDHQLGEIVAGEVPFEGAAIRLRAPRAFTQGVSRLVFDCAGAYGEPQFAGIAYRSRLGDNIHNWAVFEPPGAASPLSASASEPIAADDPDLRAALAHLGLQLA